jgi:hypothetical protein
MLFLFNNNKTFLNYNILVSNHIAIPEEVESTP